MHCSTPCKGKILASSLPHKNFLITKQQQTKRHHYKQQDFRHYIYTSRRLHKSFNIQVTNNILTTHTHNFVQSMVYFERSVRRKEAWTVADFTQN